MTVSFKKKIDLNNLPKHIAIIMDGNGRWAKLRNKNRHYGHRQGTKTVKRIVEACAEIGIKNLTLYTFSTENWNRPKEEVDALMDLLVNSINKELDNLIKNNISLKVIGDTKKLPTHCYEIIEKCVELTKNNNRLNLIMAISYSSRWEIVNAVKNIANDVKKGKLLPDSINDDIFCNYLSTKDIPDPEILIRTSGEYRISNFLLWQIAYSELFFSNKLWPDFSKNDLFEIIYQFQKRERRFGKTTEQIKITNPHLS